MPARTVHVDDHETKIAYRGVPLVDILARGGLTFGQTMRGDRLSWFLLITAADGYRAVYALPEIDPAFTDSVVLVAYARDGKRLPPDEAPLRIVSRGDERHARWVRQVMSLQVRRAP
jgi:Oxidoreductase molybdopterin binding domain